MIVNSRRLNKIYKSLSEEEIKLGEKLYEPLVAYVTGVVSKILKRTNRELAHDIATVLLVELRGRFNGKCQYSTWVHRVTETLVKAHCRKTAVQRSREVPLVYALETEGHKVDSLEVLAVRELQENLSEQEAKVLELRLAGSSREDAVEILGPGTTIAWNNVTRELRSLKEN